jgi:hypothetical protein
MGHGTFALRENMTIKLNTKLNLLSSIIIAYLLCTSCTNEAPDEHQNQQQTSSGEDILWENCSFFSGQELNKLDSLQQKLSEGLSPEQDKPVFDEYLKILNMSNKSDSQILTCTPSTKEERQRLMRHFIFLGLSYGKGEFSFVDKERLASPFERDYFYFLRSFSIKGINAEDPSESDKKIAKYLLGGIIAMQASLKMKNENVSAVAKNIGEGFLTLKYGRTSIFNQILFEQKDKLEAMVAAFLAKDQAFSTAFTALKNTVSVKTYPLVLKKDQPFLPRDYSEILGMEEFNKVNNSVFGVDSGNGGGMALGTGFFALHNAKTIFITAGHWQWGPQISLMQQKDFKPQGARPSELIWLREKLDIFNFSQGLLVPIFKALGLNDKQITSLKAKIGDNPFSGNFTLVQHLPWIDMAIGVPSPALLREAALGSGEVEGLGSLDTSKYFTGYSMGFGTTEDLEAGGVENTKSPGFRRFTYGHLGLLPFSLGEGPKLVRMLLYTPLKLNHFESHPYRAKGISVYSMKFGPRCSGAPFFAGRQIVGLLQGPFNNNEGEYIAMRAVHFTPENLALIDELVNDPRGIRNIPEADLVNALRKHMFSTDAIRQEMRAHLIKVYSL